MSDPSKKSCAACGEPNEAHAGFCATCKASLMSFDDPSAEPQTEQPAETDRSSSYPQPSLAHLECLSQPEFVFQLQDGSIVGRRGDVNVTPLEKSIYISGEHVRFFYREGRWLLEHLSQRNSTYVNGIEVLPGNLQELYDGDKITLANTSFLFREVIE